MPPPYSGCKPGIHRRIAGEIEQSVVDIVLVPVSYTHLDVYKRQAGYYAGALIEQSGLKGYAIGDAQVSEKHAGFIINRGNATAKEVQALISHVIHTVKQKQGVALCPEVKIIGEN